MKRLFFVVASAFVATSAFTHSQLPSLRTSFHAASSRTTVAPSSTTVVSPFRTIGNSQVTPKTGPLFAVSPLLAAGSPLGSIAILAFIVLVHESGHFLAAKNFGIKVEEFSIGFGPKLFGFKAGGDEFNLRALPLGGYVRFPENYNVTEARILEQADLQASEEFIRSRNPGLGSQLLNAVTLGALEDKMWNDEKRRRAEEAAASAQEDKQQPVPWWKTFGTKKETKVPAAIGTMGEIEYYDDPNLLQNRPWQQRAVVLSGGVVFNLLLAFVLYFGQISLGPGLPVPTFDNGIVVSATPRPEAAANGLLRQGDVIVGVDGVPIMSSSSSPSALESQKSISDFIAKIRATPEGESLALTVVHANEAKPVKVVVQPKRGGSDKSPMTIGVLLSPNYVKTELMKTNNPIEAADLAFKYVTTLTKETANGLSSFAAALVSGGGGAGSQVSGPLGLLKTGSEVVASKDWTTVLLFTAAISINLGVINSIPLPALDGGQLAFVLVEALTGKKVNQRFQEGVTGVAVFFLLLLSASTFVGDLSMVFGR
jgi:membrane-associated protease RseP (regulator of RpoE activity)